MDSSCFLMTCAVAIGFFTLLGTLFFMLYRKFRFRQNNETVNSSSLSLPSPPSSSPRNYIHHVFPSFHGADIRKSFLSHFIKEFKSKGIDLFIDNNIERSKSIGPELIEAIRGSRIAMVLLSRNYASSTWCLNELVEIMKCREELSQTVMVVFYELDPSDVKKQTGDFGKVFKKTCKGKTKEDIERWRHALAEMAQIAGYASTNWATEEDMIEKIASNVSNKLFNSTRSRDFDDFIGLGSHLEKMKPLLCLESDEVRMIGIWGPPGIGKTTIARFLFNQLSEPGNHFQHILFMANIRTTYAIPICSDDYTTKLDLQQNFMSQIINHKDIKVPHLGIAEQRLSDKKVLVVLDDVHRSLQLEAMAKESRWFGPGSRIIVTTQDQNLLKAHGINHIYKVGVPTHSLQIFCMYAFEQKSPKDGFEKLAWEVTLLAGQIPLGLRVLGSYFKGKSKQKWKSALPGLRSSLNGEIESVLKFSYDALCETDKSLFLHLTCFFNFGSIESIEKYLGNKFSDFWQGIEVLVEKSLISIVTGYLEINSLLVQLGKEIVRKEYGSEPPIREAGQRQFLLDERDICEVLSDHTPGSASVIGIDLTLSKTEDENELTLSERAFEKMSNLQFLKIGGDCSRLYFPPSLNSISRKLIVLSWGQFPLTYLPVKPRFLVHLSLSRSKLEKLWDENRPLRNLKNMDLTNSKNLKELPDLSTATNLETLRLGGCSSLVKLPDLSNATNLKLLGLDYCSSLVELPSFLGNATNLMTMRLGYCSSLVEISSVGNATHLQELDLQHCSNLVELPFSIGNLHKLLRLYMEGCEKLKVLPININMESLEDLDLRNCPQLKTFPEISTNIKILRLNGSPIEEAPLGIRSWSRLEELHMSYCENLKDSPHALDSITDLHFDNKEIKELGSWVSGFSSIRRILLKGLLKLVSLPQLPNSLLFLDAENCESLESLDCSFPNPDISLNFFNCFKLSKEARDRIIQASNRPVAVLPGGEVPAYFSDRATGGTVTVRLNERPLHKSLKFKVCITLVDKVHNEPRGVNSMYVSYKIMDKQNGLIVPCVQGYLHLPCAIDFTGHLFTFVIEIDVTSNELCFELSVYSKAWAVKECGVLQLS